MVGELLQSVEGSAIEVEEGGSGGGVREEACEAGWIAGLEVAACAWFDAGQKAEGRSHIEICTPLMNSSLERLYSIHCYYKFLVISLN